MERSKMLHCCIILVTGACTHAFLFYMFGIRDEFVDSLRYIQMADYLLSNGHFQFFYQIFYAIPVALLAVFRFAFENGIIAFIIFQSLLSLVAAFALYDATSRLFKNDVSGLIAALCYFLWIDCLQWNTALMTESLASSITCFMLYHLVGFRRTVKDFMILAALLSCSILTRPTGVVLVLAVTVFFITRYYELPQRNSLRSFALILFSSLVFLAGAVLMIDHWDFTDQYERGNVVTYMDTIEGQPHYSERLRLDTSGLTLPEPHMSPFNKIIFFAMHNPLHFFKAGVLKIFYTVSWYRPYFSTIHNLYTGLWLLLTYTFSYVGFRKTSDVAVRNFAVALILSNCLLVGITAADWDNRFFLPMQPVIVLLSGGGAAHIFRLLMRRLKFPSSRYF